MDNSKKPNKLVYSKELKALRLAIERAVARAREAELNRLADLYGDQPEDDVLVTVPAVSHVVKSFMAMARGPLARWLWLRYPRELNYSGDAYPRTWWQRYNYTRELLDGPHKVVVALLNAVHDKNRYMKNQDIREEAKRLEPYCTLPTYSVPMEHPLSLHLVTDPWWSEVAEVAEISVRHAKRYGDRIIKAGIWGWIGDFKPAGKRGRPPKIITDGYFVIKENRRRKVASLTEHNRGRLKELVHSLGHRPIRG